MDAFRGGIAFLAVIVCSSCSCCVAAESTKDSARKPMNIAAQLTPEQTLGVIFGAVRTTPYEQYARGNPKAKSAVFTVLRNHKYKEFHKNCVLMIGFIGQEDDIRLLEEHIRAMSQKELSLTDCLTIECIPRALAIMVRRGVESSNDKMSEMLTRSYWDQFSIKNYPKLPANAKHVSVELVAVTTRATAFVDADYAKRAFEESLRQESNPDQVEFLRKRSSPKMLQEIAAATDDRMRQDISHETLLALSVMSNGDLDNPAPNPRFDEEYRALLASNPKNAQLNDVVDEENDQLIDEAAKEFAKINEAISTGKPDTVWNRVFDLSHQIPRPAPLLEKPTISSNLGKLKDTAISIKDKELDKHNATVRVVYIRDAATKKQMKVVEVLIGVAESRDALILGFADGRGATIDRNKEQLVVVMRKVGQKWYLHPFGW